jgi:hypothetical protein
LDFGPKSNDDNAIVASGSRQSQFRLKLEEAGVSPEIINTCAKDKKLTQNSNPVKSFRQVFVKKM